MTIKFGPAGLGGVDEAIKNLEAYSKLGLKACEIAFTYGVYIKNKEDAEKIKTASEKLGIQLSIHAPYYINLNSEDKIKIAQSKQRILECLKVGTLLGAKKVVFHPGFYGKISKEETYQNIKKGILEIIKEARAKNYAPELAPETTGKINVFGSVEEIKKLVEDTHCAFCIDFAHVLAREKNYNFEKVFKEFGKYKDWHIHFSGINYGEKGEKNHKDTSKEEWKKLVSNLKKIEREKHIVVINEAPNPVKDAEEGKRIWEEMKK